MQVVEAVGAAAGLGQANASDGYGLGPVVDHGQEEHRTGRVSRPVRRCGGGQLAIMAYGYLDDDPGPLEPHQRYVCHQR